MDCIQVPRSGKEVPRASKLIHVGVSGKASPNGIGKSFGRAVMRGWSTASMLLGQWNLAGSAGSLVGLVTTITSWSE
jgi:hypothetical protein